MKTRLKLSVWGDLEKQAPIPDGRKCNFNLYFIQQAVRFNPSRTHGQLDAEGQTVMYKNKQETGAVFVLEGKFQSDLRPGLAWLGLALPLRLSSKAVPT